MLVILNMKEKVFHHLSEKDLYRPITSVFLSVGDPEDLSDILFFSVVFPGLAVSHRTASG